METPQIGVINGTWKPHLIPWDAFLVWRATRTPKKWETEPKLLPALHEDAAVLREVNFGWTQLQQGPHSHKEHERQPCPDALGTASL